MISDLLVNYRENPIGLDERPRFSWKLESGKQDVVQKRYQIQVMCDGKMKWDSGIVESDQSVLIPYEGKVLQPMTSYQVQVNVWDNYGALGQAAGSFETGLMTNVSGNENWKAKWITHELPEDETACPVYVRKFSLDKDKTIKAARLYTTACGVYEASINGKKVGDVFMAPGWTSYSNRIAYQTYDITSLLTGEGKVADAAFGESAGISDAPEAPACCANDALMNEIAITVANGWYKGELGFDAKPNNYGDRTALLAMLRIVYEDGTSVCIGTDTDWLVEIGEIRFSEIYHGETQDFTAKRQQVGRAALVEENNAGCGVDAKNADAYSNAKAVDASISASDGTLNVMENRYAGDGTTKTSEKMVSCFAIGSLTSQESEPVRVTKRFPVKEKIITPKGEVVFDFGQNMAGLVEVRLPELTAGSALVIRHAETLDKDGNFYTENLRTAKCTDTYIYGKDQVGMTVMPHFTFHGFRYICVEGAGQDVSADCFTACAMHTDMAQTGTFCSDNPLVNQLQSNIQWGQRGNFFDIPTDCPQRDERLGWTGDAQVFSGTASYNFNTALFFRKWLRDMAAETTAEWGVPHVVPNILGQQDGAAAWSDAAVIIPWKLYQVYGDQEMLAEQYPMMKAWVDYIYRKVKEAGSDKILWQTGFQYGDWLALDIESGSTDRTGGTDKYLVANACYAYVLRIVRDAAAVLGKTGETEEYGKRYEELVDAINLEYVTATGRLVCETQTACVLLLYFDLIRPEYRDRVLETLKTNINAHHCHLTTGFVGTPYLCHCLSENGLHDLADEIFMKEDFPGWFYAVKKGATTIWERWNSVLPDGSFDQSGMNSLNHYAYGSIGSWLYEKVAGIRPLEPGYKKILIWPFLTKGITECATSYESVYGTIRSAWSCKNGKISVDVQIPANTTAELWLPEKEEVLYVGSGIYHYEYATETRLEKDRFTMESTLGEIVADDLGRERLEQMVPGMLDNPLIQYAFAMTLSELTVMAPDSQPLYQAVLNELNKEQKL